MRAVFPAFFLLIVCALSPSGAPQSAARRDGEITAAGTCYLIKSGDSLRSVALRFHMTPQELKRQLQRPFHVGQLLFINPPRRSHERPADVKSWMDNDLVRDGDTLESIAARWKVAPEEIGDLNDLEIEADVRVGDTLASLAQKYHVTRDQLLGWNALDGADAVYPGMTLIVGYEPVRPGDKIYYPLRSRAIQTIETDLKRENGQQAGGDANLLHPGKVYQTYFAHKGDSIESLAQGRNVTVEEIRDLNAMSDEEQPKPGELLYLPPARPRTKPSPRNRTGSVPPQEPLRSQMEVGQTPVREGIVLRVTGIARQPGGVSAGQLKPGMRLSLVGTWGAGYAALLQGGGYGWVNNRDVRLGDYVGSTRLSAPPAGNVSRLLKIAYTYLGVPYVWGGNSYRGIDCSGFVKNVYVAAGLWNGDSPRLGREQMRVGVAVSPEQLQPGDRIYFTFGKNGPGIPDHTGIYVGGGQVMHASCSRGVCFSCLFAGRLWRAFMGARRDMAHAN